MGFANVRFCKRFLKHSHSYVEGNIFRKIAFAKPTLWASLAFAYASLLFFDLTTARTAKECLA
jgi:hypothetical protein